MKLRLSARTDTKFAALQRWRDLRRDGNCGTGVDRRPFLHFLHDIFPARAVSKSTFLVSVSKTRSCLTLIRLSHENTGGSLGTTARCASAARKAASAPLVSKQERIYLYRDLGDQRFGREGFLAGWELTASSFSLDKTNVSTSPSGDQDAGSANGGTVSSVAKAMAQGGDNDDDSQAVYFFFVIHFMHTDVDLAQACVVQP